MGKRLSNEEVQNRLNQYFVERVTLVSDYKNRREPIRIRCEECGYEWEASASNVLYEGRHRCPRCKNNKNKNGIYVKCAYCGKEIYRTKSQINKSKTGLFYCSHTCGNRHKNDLRRMNGEWDESTNYRLKAFNNYPHECKVCGWNEDERILEVHHIDGNRENNNIDNLCILCPTCHRKITLNYYTLIEDKLIENKD